MSTDIRAKLEATARMLEGRVKDSESASAICVQGYIAGFPCRLEAINPNWPFGVSYSVNTEVIPRDNSARELFTLVVLPRIGRGLLGFITRLLFFEAAGMKVEDRELQRQFIFNCTSRTVLEQFLGYPGIREALIKLHDLSFNELKIVSNAGLYLSQPKSFEKLDPGACRETFRHLADIGQALYEKF